MTLGLPTLNFVETLHEGVAETSAHNDITFREVLT